MSWGKICHCAYTSYVASLLVVDLLENNLVLTVGLILMKFLIINRYTSQPKVALISTVRYFSIEILHKR